MRRKGWNVLNLEAKCLYVTLGAVQISHDQLWNLPGPHLGVVILDTALLCRAVYTKDFKKHHKVGFADLKNHASFTLGFGANVVRAAHAQRACEGGSSGH